jgi:uncharacterized protein (TIGR03435 family)
MRMGVFQKKSATMADLAGFLSGLMDREVFDKTGIAGRYRFDIDWQKKIQDTMAEHGRRGDPVIVFAGVQRLGLKLEPGKEPLKVMIIDHVNKEPTAN